MDLLLWITVGFIIIGFVVLAFIKRNMESKKSSTTQSIVWWGASLIFIGWWFSKI